MYSHASSSCVAALEAEVRRLDVLGVDVEAGTKEVNGESWTERRWGIAAAGDAPRERGGLPQRLTICPLI